MFIFLTEDFQILPYSHAKIQPLTEYLVTQMICLFQLAFTLCDSGPTSLRLITDHDVNVPTILGLLVLTDANVPTSLRF